MAKEPVKGNRTDDSLVFVVDDDLSVRQAIKSLLQSVGLQVEDFGSAAELLKDRRLADRSAAACLVLDVRLPGVSGLDVQAELSNAAIDCAAPDNCHLPRVAQNTTFRPRFDFCHDAYTIPEAARSDFGLDDERLASL